jgi:hypothetical protein
MNVSEIKKSIGIIRSYLEKIEADLAMIAVHEEEREDVNDEYFGIPENVVTNIETFFLSFSSSDKAQDLLFKCCLRINPSLSTMKFEQYVSDYFKSIELTKRSSTIGDYRNHLKNYLQKRAREDKPKSNYQIA